MIGRDLLFRGRGAEVGVRAPAWLVRVAGAALALGVMWLADATGIWFTLGVARWKASVGAVIEGVIAGALGTPVYEDAEPLGSIYAARAEDISDALEPGSDRSLAWILAGESSAFERELNAIAALQEAKRADYTGGGNLLANYKFSSASVGLSTLRGMFMRFSEKYYRAQVLINSGDAPQVKDEGIEDTFRDLAIIAILMRLCIKGEDGYEG